MKSSAWLKSLRHRLTGQVRNPGRRTSRPRLEVLEDRTTPSTVTWDGGGGNFDWNNALNWNADALPGAGDDVQIGGAYAAATISSGSNVSIHSLTSEASLSISGGIFSIANTSSIARDLSLSATLAGDGSLVVNGHFDWQGGSITGLGTVTAAGTLRVVWISSLNHHLDGRTLVNAGDGNWDSGHIALNHGAEFVNTGTLAAPAGFNAFSDVGGGTFTNAAGATLTKTGAGTITYIHSGVAFHNQGMVAVNSGELYASSGDTTGTGSFAVATGATLELYNHTLGAGTSISGAGSVGLGNDTVGGTYAVTGSTGIGGGLTDFTGTVASVGLDLSIGGTADFHANPISVTNLTVAGELRNTAAVDVAGHFDWQGGSITGSGTVTAAGTLRVVWISSLNHYLDGRTLVNVGDGNWDSGHIALNHGAEFVNTGTLAAPAGFNAFSDVGGGTFTNAAGATLTKTGAGTITYIHSGVAFHNQGMVAVNSGELYASSGDTTGTGSFAVATGATLELYNHTLGAGTSISGAGTVGLGNDTVGGTYAVTGSTGIGGGLTDFTGTVASVGLDLSIGGTADFHANPISVTNLTVAGELRNTAAVDVAGHFDWQGGSITGSGTVTAAGTLRVVWISSLNHYLDGRTLVNVGDGNWDSGHIALNHGAEFVNTGTLAAPAGFNAFSDVGGGTFTNAAGATLTKTGAGTITYIHSGVAFHNQGMVAVNSGELYASSGDTTGTGSFAVATGATLELYNHTLGAGTSISGAGSVGLGNDTVGGTYAVTGSTGIGGGLTDFTGTVTSVGHDLSIGGTADFHANPISVTNLTVAGELRSTAALDVAGHFDWQGGSITGSGTVTAAGTLRVVWISSLNHYLDGRTLVNVGDGNWDSGHIALNHGAEFVNTGTLAAPAGFNAFSDVGGGTFTNAAGATLTKTGAGTITYIHSGVAFHNQGMVAVNSGELYASSGDTTGTGSFAVATGATLELYNHTLGAGTSISGAGSVGLGNDTVGGTYTVTGSTGIGGGLTDFTGTVTSVGHDLSIGGTADFHANPISVTNLTVAGELRSTAAVDVAGHFDWQGGSITGSGTVTAAGTLRVVWISSLYHYLDGRTLVNAGDGNWDSGHIALNHGAEFVNTGTLAAPAGFNAFSDVGGGTFTNAAGATLTKTGAGTITYIHSGVAFHNQGMVAVNSGELYASSGDTTGTGSFAVATGATLELYNHTLGAGTSISGAGSVGLGNDTVGGTYAVTGSTGIGGGLTDFTGTVTSVGHDLSIGGTADFHANPISVTNLTVAGELRSTAAVDVAGHFDWQGGSITGSGTVTAAGTLRVVWISSLYHYLDGRTLVNAGDGNWDSGHIALNHGAEFVNTGTLAAPAGFNAFSDVGGGTFTNAAGATLTKTGAGTITYIHSGVAFHNQGMVAVNSGELYASSGDTTGTGSFAVATGATLELYNHTLGAGTSISGAGSVGLGNDTVGGTYAVTGSTGIGGGLTDFTGTVTSVGHDLSIGGTADFHANPISVTNLTVAGELRSTAALDVAGHFDWQGGSITGSGTVTAAGTLRVVWISSLYHYLDGRTLVNAGDGNWDSGHIALNHGAEFVNTGTLAAPAGFNAFSDVGGGTFTNAAGATLTKTGAGTITYIHSGVAFHNQGMVAVNSGELYASSGDTTGTGSFAVATGATLELYNHTLGAGTSISGAGSVGLGNDTVGGTYAVTGSTGIGSGLTDFTGTVTSVGDLYVGGTASFVPIGGPATLAIPSLTVTGTLRGTDNFRVTGPFSWAGGTLQGVAGLGSLTVLSDMTLNGTYTVRDFNLINAGHAVWTGGTVQFYGDSTFTNAAGATLDIQIDSTFGSFDGHCIRFNNVGTLVKSAGTGITYLNAVLYNSSTVRIESGQLQLSCGYVQNNPGRPPDNIIYPPGDGPRFDDGGETPLPPGDPNPPVFTTYKQTVTGALIEQIVGHTPPEVYGIPGVDYGQLVVLGDVALGGSFVVQLLGGFVPTAGQKFLVIDNRGSHPIDGTFIDLPEGATVWAGVYGFTISYVGGTGNDVVLTSLVVHVPPVVHLGGNAAINENGTFTRAASFVGTGSTFTATVNYGDGSGTHALSLNADKSFSLSHVYGSPGAFTVTVQIVDGHGDTGTGILIVTVNNLAPVVQPITGPGSAIPGQVLAFVAAFTDGGSHTALWSWGDGNTNPAIVSEANGAGTSSGSHAYAANGTYTVTVTVKDSGLLSASRTFTVIVANAVYVLNTSASGALTISGNGSIHVPGMVVVDSNSASALSASGNAQISASTIKIVGGFSRSGNASLSPTPQTHVAIVLDPLAALTAPTSGVARGSVNLTGNNSLTINPGVYSQITVAGNARLTLNPGVYIIAGGGLSVSGNATVTGTGVVFYNAGSNFPSSGGNFGGIALSGNASFNLTAPTSGPYVGIVIFQARDNTRALALSGNGMVGIQGSIYAPVALLTLSGNAAVNNPLVVNTLTISGNGSSTLATDGADSHDSSAGQLLAINIYLYIDNDSNGGFTNAQAARIQDAVAGIETLLAPYGVVIVVVDASERDLANFTLDIAPTTANGGLAQGILGSTKSTGEITLVSGWDWFTGMDSSAIQPGQYDFQTVVTHELGHALGLGHSTDPSSVMYATLAPAQVRRTITVADLAVPDLDQQVYAHPLLAAPFVEAQGSGCGCALCTGAASLAGQATLRQLEQASAEHLPWSNNTLSNSQALDWQSSQWLAAVTYPDPASLGAFLAKWTTADTYALRVPTALESEEGSPMRGSVLLKTDELSAIDFDESDNRTLHDDSGRDWFFAKLGEAVVDDLTDRANNDLVLAIH